ncbi:MAG: Arm DNA-binding domain-containing protein [Candidatus Tisiphia sp.]
MAIYSFNLTKEAIDKIAYPKIKRDIYVDTKEDGLILIVSYGGSKVFYLRETVYGINRKIKLGNFHNDRLEKLLNDISLVEAREKAVEIKGQINKVIHPFNKSPILNNEINHQPTKATELTFKQFFLINILKNTVSVRIRIGKMLLIQ